MKEDDKVEEERGNKSKSAVVVRVGGDAGLPSADVTKNSLCNGPKSASDDNEALPKKSDLDVGATSMLPSLVKVVGVVYLPMLSIAIYFLICSLSYHRISITSQIQSNLTPSRADQR